ncbi:beta-ketoacyl synthase N-terminal-like domain-containing protein [Nocardia sp. NPDC050710]|uniref:beta-ketoacyl synthase N-terminal-like domain-containing protein n=1 Tax=Nocardia sp. NPDC050710 TaxID=3157220 RepID=UPI00340CAD63
MIEPASPVAVTPMSRALATINRLKGELAERTADQPLAVVGIGLRFPGQIDDLGALWQALSTGRDLTGDLPDRRRQRFSAEWAGLPQRGGFLGDVFGFDAKFFSIGPQEARAMDPQHRLLLEVAWEAFENGACVPNSRQSNPVGVYVGISTFDYLDWLGTAKGPFLAPGAGHCFAAGRIAHVLNLTGPAVAIDTACSSSLVALHLARQAICRGECTSALVAGVNLVLSPRTTRLLHYTTALSRQGVCRAFDARADGFVRSDGAAAIVVKRLSDAVRDADRIHAVIVGSAVNQDARSAALTAPSAPAQADVIGRALKDAGLGVADIGLIEAHGTGTALGDPIEVAGIASAFTGNGGRKLFVGSLKANTGHMEAAAGIGGLVKVIASLQQRTIPPLAHFTTLNPRIDLARVPIAFASEPTPWTSDIGRFAGVSSFGMSGTNAHVVVGSAPEEQPRDRAPVTGFEIGAQTPTALRELARRYHTHLAHMSDHDFAAFSYTATAVGRHHRMRARIAARDRRAAMAALHSLTDASSLYSVVAEPESPNPLDRVVADLPNYPWERKEYVLGSTS